MNTDKKLFVAFFIAILVSMPGVYGYTSIGGGTSLSTGSQNSAAAGTFDAVGWGGTSSVESVGPVVITETHLVQDLNCRKVETSFYVQNGVIRKKSILLLPWEGISPFCTPISGDQLLTVIDADEIRVSEKAINQPDKLEATNSIVVKDGSLIDYNGHVDTHRPYDDKTYTTLSKLYCDLTKYPIAKASQKIFDAFGSSITINGQSKFGSHVTSFATSLISAPNKDAEFQGTTESLSGSSNYARIDGLLDGTLLSTYKADTKTETRNSNGNPVNCELHDLAMTDRNGVPSILGKGIFWVDDSWDGKIQAAIDAAWNPGGDLVNVAPGIYTENLLVKKQLTLSGSGKGINPYSDTLIVPSDVNEPIISINNGVTTAANPLLIKNLQVMGALGSSGILIQAPSSFVTLENIASVGNKYGIYLDANGIGNRISDVTTNVNGNGIDIAGSLDDGIFGLATNGAIITKVIFDNAEITGSLDNGVHLGASNGGKIQGSSPSISLVNANVLLSGNDGVKLQADSGGLISDIILNNAKISDSILGNGVSASAIGGTILKISLDNAAIRTSLLNGVKADARDNGIIQDFHLIGATIGDPNGLLSGSGLNGISASADGGTIKQFSLNDARIYRSMLGDGVQAAATNGGKIEGFHLDRAAIGDPNMLLSGSGVNGVYASADGIGSTITDFGLDDSKIYGSVLGNGVQATAASGGKIQNFHLNGLASITASGANGLLAQALDGGSTISGLSATGAATIVSSVLSGVKLEAQSGDTITGVTLDGVTIGDPNSLLSGSLLSNGVTASANGGTISAVSLDNAHIYRSLLNGLDVQALNGGNIQNFHLAGAEIGKEGVSGSGSGLNGVQALAGIGVLDQGHISGLNMMDAEISNSGLNGVFMQASWKALDDSWTSSIKDVNLNNVKISNSGQNGVQAVATLGGKLEGSSPAISATGATIRGYANDGFHAEASLGSSIAGLNLLGITVNGQDASGVQKSTENGVFIKASDASSSINDIQLENAKIYNSGKNGVYTEANLGGAIGGSGLSLKNAQIEDSGLSDALLAYGQRNGVNIQVSGILGTTSSINSINGDSIKVHGSRENGVIAQVAGLGGSIGTLSLNGARITESGLNSVSGKADGVHAEATIGGTISGITMDGAQIIGSGSQENGLFALASAATISGISALGAGISGSKLDGVHAEANALGTISGLNLNGVQITGSQANGLHALASAATISSISMDKDGLVSALVSGSGKDGVHAEANTLGLISSLNLNNAQITGSQENGLYALASAATISSISAIGAGISGSKLDGVHAEANGLGSISGLSLNGAQITGSQENGLYALATGATISNINANSAIIRGSVKDGVHAEATTGLLGAGLISNVDLTGIQVFGKDDAGVKKSTGNGVFIKASGLFGLTANKINDIKLENAVVMDSGQNGVYARATDAGKIDGTNGLSLKNVLISNSGSNGALIRADSAGSISKLNAYGLQVDNSGANGVKLLAKDAFSDIKGTGTSDRIDFSKATITSSGADGINLEASSLGYISGMQMIATANYGGTITGSLGNGLNAIGNIGLLATTPISLNYVNIYNNNLAGGAYGVRNGMDQGSLTRRSIDAKNCWWGTGGIGTNQGKYGQGGNNDKYDGSPAPVNADPFANRGTPLT